jgi:hypothetical protein
MRYLYALIITLAAAVGCTIEDVDSSSSSSGAESSSTTGEPCEGLACDLPDVDVDADVDPELGPGWCSTEDGYSCQHMGNCMDCPGVDCTCDCPDVFCLPNSPPNWVQTTTCPTALGNIRCSGCTNGGTMTNGGCVPVEIFFPIRYTVESVPDGCQIYGGPVPLHWQPWSPGCAGECC